MTASQGNHCAVKHKINSTLTQIIIKMAKANLIIRSNIKKVLPEEMRLGVKVPDRLNEVIEELIKKSVDRAKLNKRTTILPQDI